MKSWIAVASAEHVRSGRSQGFMQVCHGKAAPLRRDVCWFESEEAAIIPLLN